MAVEGNYTIQIKALDHMIKSIFEASKNIYTPDNANKTLYEDMREKHAKLKKKKSALNKPNYMSPGGDSDDVMFTQRYGIPVSDYRYIYNKLDAPASMIHNGQYHTLYDSFDWLSKFIDPKFEYHFTLGKLWLKHALILANRVIIPFDLEAFSEQLGTKLDEFEEEYEKEFKKHDVSIEFAKDKIDGLVKQAGKFQKFVKNANPQNMTFYTLRALNDKIMNFEKHFILMNQVGTQSLKNVYLAGKTFGGIVRAINEKPGKNWDNVRREITLLIWCIDMANRSLDLDELQVRTFIFMKGLSMLFTVSS